MLCLSDLVNWIEGCGIKAYFKFKSYFGPEYDFHACKYKNHITSKCHVSFIHFLVQNKHVMH